MRSWKPAELAIAGESSNSEVYCGQYSKKSEDCGKAELIEKATHLGDGHEVGSMMETWSSSAVTNHSALVMNLPSTDKRGF